MSIAVLPGLEKRLVDAKLADLAGISRQYRPLLRRAVGTSLPQAALKDLVRRTADTVGVRVTVLLVVSNRDEGITVEPGTDSASERDISLDFPVAVDAARTGRTERGTEAGPNGRIGEVAEPFAFRNPETGRRRVGHVVVFSTPLRDVEASVAVVERRVLVAGGVASGLALLAGFLVAQGLTRRVRGVEAGARRVAAGDFSARFPVDRPDELGELARTLDDMRRQLAELDSARKRFIATASHELRTPIFSLGGFLELLADEDLDSETRQEFLGQVREQVARLSRLAVDLLDLSKLEAGALELRPERTDITLLARRVAQEFIPALVGHDSRLELRVPGSPVEAICDPERVAQVMRILIDNAITHTPDGTDMVVSASRRDGFVRFGVGDFGPGIRRTMLPHIFEPFITSDDALGSGLGLAIAHELAERMEGELVVESQPGRTTFTLELPA
ncbi:MAG: Osmosensitive K+ channel histidine kinase KdpD [uncultured Solirubrobacteraceae bacterium]|uniref:histidine kinase n=1 Tax=uncultured Solirubrobacteraceae bacterium TaxID=1162706 RepID=A0A6J4S492_9ACTN|nr:MAG: Osmosensitive K+ channel histidine kinase KdpD [uncultured Solirubrobacteraceae bacterium]